jgi:hypothetical protein
LLFFHYLVCIRLAFHLHLHLLSTSTHHIHLDCVKMLAFCNFFQTDKMLTGIYFA